ncbi:DUF4405 domain-containing protein, partial [Candidatus Woesearchaeota archaeon]|nr:DUF4405 domain-containing protein [Candidatus Woesearchaeota archaeon]
MNRAHLNYWVDFALLLSFLTVGLTGLVKFFFFLNGNTLGLPVRTFNTVHDYAGVTMVVLVG